MKMKQESKRIIITKSNINNKGNLNILTYPKNNLNDSETILTKFNNKREMKIININQINKKIELKIYKKKKKKRKK